jgi:hypothetical protein
VSGTRLWTDRHAIGTDPSLTRAPKPGIVAIEGGGFNPTRSLGGGAGLLSLAEARARRWAA